MPDTRPDLDRRRRRRGHRLPAARRAPHRAAPRLRTGLLTRLAGIGTLRDRDGLLLLTSHESAAAGPAGNDLVTTIYLGTDLNDADVCARAVKLRAREGPWSCPTRTRSWWPGSLSTWARPHDHRRTASAHQPHRAAAPQRHPCPPPGRDSSLRLPAERAASAAAPTWPAPRWFWRRRRSRSPPGAAWTPRPTPARTRATRCARPTGASSSCNA